VLAVSEVFSLGYPIFVTVSEDEATNALMTSASDSGRISHPASSYLTARALGYGRGAALSQYLLLPLARTETNHVKEPMSPAQPMSEVPHFRLIPAQGRFATLSHFGPFLLVTGAQAGSAGFAARMPLGE